jgi:alpha-1,2-mannosyltransferase
VLQTRLRAGPAPSRLTRPTTSPRRGGLVVLAGAAALASTLALYRINLLRNPPREILSLLDLRLYAAAGQVARHAPAALYRWQFLPGMRFTYTPFAALLFAGLGHLPWPVLAALTTAASIGALGLAVWLTLGALGWAGRRHAGAAMALTAAGFWTEPVQRVLHWGQVDLLLMALVVWDLCQGDQRWWKGAGTGLAAGIKLVPLIFLLYLVITGRIRQAAVGLATFLVLAGAGYAVLPGASAQWWFGRAFLHPGRTGFVGYLANQSLLGMFTRESGSLAAGTAWGLVTAAVVGVTGLGAAAVWHRAGRPVHGWVTCALTGLLVSPVSWDHHWVWIVLVLPVLADAAVRARQVSHWAGRAAWAAAVALAALFAAWPLRWPPPRLLPWGLIWAAPHTFGGAADRPWDSEYHWHLAASLAGNLYLLAGLAALGVLAVLAPGPGSVTARDRDHVQGLRRERHISPRPWQQPQVGQLAVQEQRGDRWRASQADLSERHGRGDPVDPCVEMPGCRHLLTERT